MGRLDAKVALITGACSGIGLGSLQLFVAEGAKVVVADVQDDKGADLERRFPNAVRYVHCDVTVEADIAAACSAGRDAFGGLDILYNNAGRAGLPGGVETVTAEGWDAVFVLLVRAPVLAMKHALPLMLERGGGSIINTSSIAGLEAGWGPLAYSTAKAAVTHMSRCAAAELSPKNVRVNTLCPGLIATPMFGKELGMSSKAADELAQLVAKNAAVVQPIPRAGLPSDIAAAALYLASDESRFVSGIQIVIDGALTVGGRHAWDPATPSPFAAIPGVNPEAMQALMRGSDT